MLAITFLWMVCCAVLAFLRPFPLEELIVMGDIYQLVLGFGAMVILRARLNHYPRKYILLGTGLAIFSWTTGQLFWFSYTLLEDFTLPYPFVGCIDLIGCNAVPLVVFVSYIFWECKL
jgi:hypothetical protein